jgi:hypothetical protein
LSKTVILSLVNFTQVPSSAFLSIHHRHSLRSYEVAAQFILEPFFQKHTVITSLGVLKKASNYLEKCLHTGVEWFLKHIYDNFSIDDMTSNERYWHIYEKMGPNCAVSVFPDREGSQFYGDEIFYFRDGLFAASLATQVPIIDQVIVEPTPNTAHTTIDFLLHTPPKNQAQVFTNADDYALWRIQNQTTITAYTLECEKVFRKQLKLREHEKESFSHQGLCDIMENSGIEKRIQRNSYYVGKPRP